MRQYGNGMRWLTESERVLPGVPVVELAGDRRVLIENHKGVVEYGKERICVKVQYGLLCICGIDMELAKMSKEQLVIAGKIESVSIHRKGKI